MYKQKAEFFRVFISFTFCDCIMSFIIICHWLVRNGKKISLKTTIKSTTD